MISIGCSAVGIPQPFVEWQFGDTNEIVKHDTKYSLTDIVERNSSKGLFEVSSNLTIRNPGTDDTRPYICSAINHIFKPIPSRTIHVIVLGLLLSLLQCFNFVGVYAKCVVLFCS